MNPIEGELSCFQRSAIRAERDTDVQNCKSIEERPSGCLPQQRYKSNSFINACISELNDNYLDGVYRRRMQYYYSSMPHLLFLKYIATTRTNKYRHLTCAPEVVRVVFCRPYSVRLMTPTAALALDAIQSNAFKRH
jgi:hypothetical protein